MLHIFRNNKTEVKCFKTEKLKMALRNADSYFARSLRNQPTERPKPLRRGQGVGGGNYRNLPQEGSVST